MNLPENTCSVMQPTYLPWIGYFDLIASAKDFIFLDNVKFNKSSYHHQNKILGTNNIILLSVPTHTKKGRMETLINEVEIDNSRKWKKKHLMSIEQSYKKALYFNDIFYSLEEIISSDIKKLSDLNISLIKMFASLLYLKTQFYKASDMENQKIGKVDKLIQFCHIRECDSYYSPSGSLDYLDDIENKELFASNNIEVFCQNFEIIPYMQKQKPFRPYMSILDVLMNCGVDETREILLKGHRVSKLN